MGTRGGMFLVSPVGIEPTTNWLKASCSTTELRARERTPYGRRRIVSTAAANGSGAAEIAAGAAGSVTWRSPPLALRPSWRSAAHRPRLRPRMWKTFSAVFVTVFLAEIGDKTQLATMLFSADRETNKWMVFAGSSVALVIAAAIGVLVGAQLERFVQPRTLKMIAGAGFIVIGLWTILSR